MGRAVGVGVLEVHRVGDAVHGEGFGVEHHGVGVTVGVDHVHGVRTEVQRVHVRAAVVGVLGQRHADRHGRGGLDGLAVGEYGDVEEAGQLDGGGVGQGVRGPGQVFVVRDLLHRQRRALGDVGLRAVGHLDVPGQAVGGDVALGDDQRVDGERLGVEGHGVGPGPGLLDHAGVAVVIHVDHHGVLGLGHGFRLHQGHGHGDGQARLDLRAVFIVEGDVHRVHALDGHAVPLHRVGDAGQRVVVLHRGDGHGRALGERAGVGGHAHGHVARAALEGLGGPGGVVREIKDIGVPGLDGDGRGVEGAQGRDGPVAVSISNVEQVGVIVDRPLGRIDGLGRFHDLDGEGVLGGCLADLGVHRLVFHHQALGLRHQRGQGQRQDGVGQVHVGGVGVADDDRLDDLGLHRRVRRRRRGRGFLGGLGRIGRFGRFDGSFGTDFGRFFCWFFDDRRFEVGPDRGRFFDHFDLDLRFGGFGRLGRRLLGGFGRFGRFGRRFLGGLRRFGRFRLVLDAVFQVQGVDAAVPGEHGQLHHVVVDEIAQGGDHVVAVPVGLHGHGQGLGVVQHALPRLVHVLRGDVQPRAREHLAQQRLAVTVQVIDVLLSERGGQLHRLQLHRLQLRGTFLDLPAQLEGVDLGHGRLGAAAGSLLVAGVGVDVLGLFARQIPAVIVAALAVDVGLDAAGRYVFHCVGVQLEAVAGEQQRRHGQQRQQPLPEALFPRLGHERLDDPVPLHFLLPRSGPIWGRPPGRSMNSLFKKTYL